MPDNTEPRTINEFLESAPFRTEIVVLTEEQAKEQCECDEGCEDRVVAIAQFNTWQAGFVGDVLAMALQFSERNDREVVFADDPDGGHYSLQTLMARRFLDYFADLSSSLELIEDQIKEDVAA